MNSSYYKIKHSPLSLEKFPDHLKNDKALVAYATSLNEDAFKFASPQLKCDKEFVMELLGEGMSRFIGHIDSSLHFDTTIMKKAVAMNGLLLQHVDETLRNNREICDLAIAHTPYAFKYVGEEIKKDVELTIKVLQESGMLGKDIHPIHYNNKDIIKATLTSKISYSILEKMSDELRNDKNFIMEIINLEHNFEVLGFTTLKDDKDVVLAACAKSPRSIVSASKRLQNDFDVVLCVVQQPSLTLNFLHSELVNDKKIVLTALKAHPRNKEHISEQLQSEIGNHDPIQYLESFFAKEELQSILPMPVSANSRRNKI